MTGQVGHPNLGLKIPPGYRYAGRTEIPLDDRALAIRQHLVALEDKRVQGLVIVQYERLLDGVDGEYRFEIAEPLAGSRWRKSPERIPLAGYEFVHHTWAFDNAESA